MKAAAGTEVVADILFLQRRFPMIPARQSLDTLMEALPAEDGEPAVSINRYSLNIPKWSRPQRANQQPLRTRLYCLPHTQGGIEELLDSAIRRCPRASKNPHPSKPRLSSRFSLNVQVGTAAEGPH